MTKTHPPKKIIFCPINIEIDYDESQGIYFVFLETEPFDYEEIFPVRNPKTGKLEGKSETQKFSHLRLTFNSQSEINRFSSLVKKSQLHEMETSWSSACLSGRNGGELVNQVNINETNPQIKRHLAEKETGYGYGKVTNMSSLINASYAIWILVVGGGILVIVFGLVWWKKNKN